MDGRFTPSIQGLIWINTKFKLELGIETSNGDKIYKSAGIFVIANPNSIHNNGEKNINIQCYDKFALLDGTLGGVLDAVYEVNVNSNVRDACEYILKLDNGNGLPIDIKDVMFDSMYAHETTVYRISKSPNESLGSILIELAEMLGCDIYYDENGYLNIRSGIEDIANVNKPILWKYTTNEMEYISSETTYDFSKVKNRVIIIGSNTSSQAIYRGVAENHNPQSPTRISLIGTKNLYYEDSNIHSTELAQQRAEYELNKISILQQTINISSIYMIHLDVNNCIKLTDKYYNFEESRFVIQSISIPLATDSTITITCSNVGSLPYYPSIG